jgi:hypothetical protein
MAVSSSRLLWVLCPLLLDHYKLKTIFTLKRKMNLHTLIRIITEVCRGYTVGHRTVSH